MKMLVLRILLGIVFVVAGIYMVFAHHSGHGLAHDFAITVVYLLLQYCGWVMVFSGVRRIVFVIQIAQAIKSMEKKIEKEVNVSHG